MELEDGRFAISTGRLVFAIGYSSGDDPTHIYSVNTCTSENGQL